MADLLHHVLFSDSLLHRVLFSDSEDENDNIVRLRDEKKFYERSDFFNMYGENDFKCKFRLSKESALNILIEIEKFLEYPSERNYPVSPMNQMLLALRFYATGSYSLTLANYMGVSRATANRIIHRVSKALCSLNTKYIKFPKSHEEIKSAQILNHGIASFPKVIGMVDCTHIKILSPGGEQAELFRNRKGYSSLIVQIICNANLEINDIVARWPGSTPDSTIFNKCYRKAMFEDGRYEDSFLLGDSGYPSLPYLMTPVENPVTRAQELYNESQIQTHNCVEQLFGLWKRRFPVLAVGFNLKLKNIFPVITATAVLHNVLREMGDMEPPDDPSLTLPAPWDVLLSAGQIPVHQPPGSRNECPGHRMRNVLIGEYFHRL